MYSPCRSGVPSAAVAGCLAALGLVALTGVMAAQAPTFADVRAAALQAMGGPVTDIVARLEYRGAGWDACLGQAWNVTAGCVMNSCSAALVKLSCLATV